MNLLFSTTSVVEKKSDILYNRSGVKNSIFWVKNQKRRGNSMRKKKLWKKHCALGMAIVLASGNAVTPALADNTAVQVDNDTENDNKAENLDFETKDDETDHPDKGDSEGDNNTENNAKDDSNKADTDQSEKNDPENSGEDAGDPDKEGTDKDTTGSDQTDEKGVRSRR